MSFQNHPGLRDREPEAREMADVLRRLIRLSVSAAPPAAETARLTARLSELADELETHLPAEPLPRFIPPDEDGPPKDVPLGGAMPYDVVVGPFNPVALPVVLDFEPPRALGRGVFDVTYEGAPGCVHGAVLAAAFDIILTAANAIVGSVGPTVSLALRYVRPTLTGRGSRVRRLGDRGHRTPHLQQGAHRAGRGGHGRGRRGVCHLQPGSGQPAGRKPPPARRFGDRSASFARTTGE